VTAPSTRVTVDEALDNDVVLKAVRYGATDLFWPVARHLGVLGAGKYVVAGRIKRLKLGETRPTIEDELRSFLARTEVLEPADEEVNRAAELEREAQRRSLPLDSGESQLAAMVAERAIALMTTGDKRAVATFEHLLQASPWLAGLCGHVRSLEQLVLEIARDDEVFEALAQCVCSDPDADTALRICFSCYGGAHAVRDVVEQGLVSYIGALRADAPHILAPAP
jgi:predicted nucleic acid-binding protein